MTWENVLAYAAQVLLWVAAGALLPRVMGVKEPRTLLRYFQVLLLACVLMPAAQPWLHPVLLVPAETQDDGTAPAKMPAVPLPQPFRMEEALPPVLAGGAVLRLLWLALGIWRLRRYRHTATALDPLPASVATALRQTDAAAEVKLSKELPGPVTFGARRPVILLPERFLSLPYEAQLSVACHELLHVKRCDWVYGVLEELAASAVWFHPAVWWLAARIRLAREQAVDAEVVRLTAAREHYVDALLVLAQRQPRLDYFPAQPLLTRSHVVQRIESLVNMKEEVMSKRRLYSSFSVIAVTLAVTAWLSVLTFPLTGRPQVKEMARPDAAGVKVEAGGKLLHRTGVDYPETARRRGVQGTVMVELNLAQDGTVVDGRAVSGPDELRAAALKSALDWHYAAGSPKVQVAIEYKLPAAVPATVRRATPEAAQESPEIVAVDLSSAPEALQTALRERLSRYEGRPVSMELRQEVERDIAEVDSHLRMFYRENTAEKKFVVAPTLEPMQVVMPAAAGGFATGPDRIRIGGTVQSAKRLHVERPVYPPLAKQAKIQGTVRMEVLIDKTGHIANIALISGHPLLVPPSIDAVKQWTYSSTWLNGQPVEVITTVDVNYTLLDDPPTAQQ